MSGKAKTKSTSKPKSKSKPKVSEKKAEIKSGLPNALKNESGHIVKIFTFDDPLTRAFENALSSSVFHPQGNVDDPEWQKNWASEICRKVARDMNVREPFVTVGFYNTDSLGEALPEDGNLVRVQLTVGAQMRHTLLSDPTPED